jgi:Lrp/AsnC family leucine-responsive transcriptional regulator
MIGFDSERLTNHLSDRLLDDVSWRILDLLQQDARLSFAEIGRRVNMSSPAVAERVQRMEDSGIIEGYHATVNTAKLGYPIRAAIRIATLGPDERTRALAVMNTIPEVLECHSVTGVDCFFVTVAVADMTRLDQVISQLDALGRVTTSMILNTPIAHRPIVLSAS